jgi:hypothetical protein
MAYITKRRAGKKTYYYIARAYSKNGTPTHEILLLSLRTAEDNLKC